MSTEILPGYCLSFRIDLYKYSYLLLFQGAPQIPQESWYNFYEKIHETDERQLQQGTSTLRWDYNNKLITYVYTLEWFNKIYVKLQ